MEETLIYTTIKLVFICNRVVFKTQKLCTLFGLIKLLDTTHSHMHLCSSGLLSMVTTGYDEFCRGIPIEIFGELLHRDFYRLDILSNTQLTVSKH